MNDEQWYVTLSVATSALNGKRTWYALADYCREKVTNIVEFGGPRVVHIAPTAKRWCTLNTLRGMRKTGTTI